MMDNKNREAIFIGHGSPMNVVEENSFSKFLMNYAGKVSKPKAVIVFSAHWVTDGTYITGASNPEQIYDFYGFPDELYNVKYAPKGDPIIAQRIEADNIGIKVDANRGVDHAGWAIMKHLYPAGDIPLLEISLDVNKTNEEHFELAKKLVKYRQENILFIGSGNIVHNLRDITFDKEAKPFEWAVEMDEWFKEKMNEYHIEKIVNYPKYLSNHLKGIPTTEHFIPLLYTLGLMLPEERIETIHESMQNGSISMRSIKVG